MESLLHHRDSEAHMETYADGTYSDAMPLIPCDAVGAYNFERLSHDRYRLTLAVPGFQEEDIEVLAKAGYLRVIGNSRYFDSDDEVLHRGLNGKLDHTFLMTRPLELVEFDVISGLLRIILREGPGVGVRTAIPPRLQGIEAFALAA